METLSLPCANRSKENLLPLQAFTNKINEFKKLAQSAREELLRSAQVEKFEDKETVFLHGDYGDKYYVVLSGSVDISIPKYPNKGEPKARERRESGGLKPKESGSDEGPAALEEEEPEEIVVAQLGAQCGFARAHHQQSPCRHRPRGWSDLPHGLHSRGVPEHRWRWPEQGP